MSLPVEPSGVGTPDLGWQQSGRRGRAAAARTSTTPAETLAGTQASPRHGSRTVVSTSSAQSGLPTQAQYDSYNNQLQEQMTALAAQIAALTAAMMAGQRASAAGQRASAAEARTPSPRPLPPYPFGHHDHATVCSLRTMTLSLTLMTAMQIAAAYGGDEL